MGTYIAYPASNGTFTGGVTTDSITTNTATTLTQTSSVADGAGAVGFAFNTSVALANAAAKIVKWKNNGTDKAYLDKDGIIGVGGVNTSGGTLIVQISGNDSIFRASGGTTVGNVYVSNQAEHFGVFNDTGLDLSVLGTVPKKITLWATDNSASPGATTINKPSGRGAIASGASACVVTNSTVTAASIVTVQLETSAAGVGGLVCVPASGSFTVTSVNGTGAVTVTTANAKFSFIVHN